MEILNIISFIIAVVGMVVIIWGVVLVVGEFCYLEFLTLHGIKTHQVKRDKHALRRHLGSYILLGLEFMIAGDIIHTVLKPDKEALIVLGAIVAIRTVISYFLHKELQSEV